MTQPLSRLLTSPAVAIAIRGRTSLFTKGRLAFCNYSITSAFVLATLDSGAAEQCRQRMNINGAYCHFITRSFAVIHIFDMVLRNRRVDINY